MKVGPYPVGGITSVTLVVAASNSLDPTRADYQCNGVNDNVEIQAALDALPATGGEVVLLDGTYNIEVSLVLDSYQTLRGCGRNTILTTTTADLDIITATGGSGTEKIGILIADLCVDGNAGGAINDIGIFWTYVDYSKIINTWILGTAGGEDGIKLLTCDFNTILGNTCQGNGLQGIFLHDSDNNVISGNTCQGNIDDGIYLYLSDNNTITGNNCQGNDDAIDMVSSNNNTVSDNTFQGSYYYGIHLDGSINNTIVGNTCQGNNSRGIFLDDASNSNTVSGNTSQGNGKDGIYIIASNSNTISGNTCQGNKDHGIYIRDNSDNNTVVGNTCLENSQGTTNTCDDIYLTNSDYNNIQANTCRAGALAKKPRYGINISDATCDGNRAIDNDLHDDGFGTAPFNDAGTGTRLATYVVPFSDGLDPQDSGFLLDADTEYARAWLRLPAEVQQVVRMKIYARAVVLSAAAMRLEINANGGADNEAYNTHATAAPNTPSTSTNFAADDVIFWTLTAAGIVALLGGDTVEVKVLHEAAGDSDVATNAYIRTVEIEYV